MTLPFRISWQVALVHVDDFVDFSCTAADHMNYFKHVLKRIRNAASTPNLKKYIVFTKNIGYLSHVICPESLQIASHTTISIKERIVPQSTTRL